MHSKGKNPIREMITMSIINSLRIFFLSFVTGMCALFRCCRVSGSTASFPSSLFQADCSSSKFITLLFYKCFQFCFGPVELYPGVTLTDAQIGGYFLMRIIFQVVKDQCLFYIIQ